jgi:hypothetical protein
MDLLAGLPHTPQQHFTLYFYGAVLRVAGQASLHFGSAEAANERLPFLAGYIDEIARHGLDGASFDGAYRRWRDAIARWERASAARLPLAVLRSAAGLGHDDLTLFAQIGLPDEDPRFFVVFDAMQGGIGERRPTAGLLGAGWTGDGELDGRAAAHRLHALGLVEAEAEGACGFRPCAVAWDAARGAPIIAPAAWARHRPCSSLPELATLVLSPEMRATAERLAAIIESGAADAIVLRGPRHNGRSTLAGAIARRTGKGILDATAMSGPNDPRWRTAAATACLLDAVMLTPIDPGPSEIVQLPDLPDGIAPLFVTLGMAGGVGGALADRAITVRIPVADHETRARLWRLALDADSDGLPNLRMTSGNIVRAARVARAARALDASADLDAEALRAAVRSLEHPGLEALARRVDASADCSHLALPAETQSELTTLISRCRQRERLGAFVGEALHDLGPGVRALFRGPSGTGKTLAARMLARGLDMELHCLNLASVVDKFVGETEKNLERVFARAEELDVVLLLDEGDALLAPRTPVMTANDRYANLETNYLLKRLETYSGIVLVATNKDIDGAFMRRMDVVIDFPLPDVAARWAIWQLHLPARHDVEAELLYDAAQRCALSGGQIRNVALHASLLALESGASLGSHHLEAAIAREYRKQGATSPMRARNGAH